VDWPDYAPPAPTNKLQPPFQPWIQGRPGIQQDAGSEPVVIAEDDESGLGSSAEDGDVAATPRPAVPKHANRSTASTTANHRSPSRLLAVPRKAPSWAPLIQAKSRPADSRTTHSNVSTRLKSPLRAPNRNQDRAERESRRVGLQVRRHQTPAMGGRLELAAKGPLEAKFSTTLSSPPGTPERFDGQENTHGVSSRQAYHETVHTNRQNEDVGPTLSDVGLQPAKLVSETPNIIPAQEEWSVWEGVKEVNDLVDLEDPRESLVDPSTTEHLDTRCSEGDFSSMVLTDVASHRTDHRPSPMDAGQSGISNSLIDITIIEKSCPAATPPTDSANSADSLDDLTLSSLDPSGWSSNAASIDLGDEDTESAGSSSEESDDEYDPEQSLSTPRSDDAPDHENEDEEQEDKEEEEEESSIDEIALSPVQVPRRTGRATVFNGQKAAQYTQRKVKSSVQPSTSRKQVIPDDSETTIISRPSKSDPSSPYEIGILLRLGPDGKPHWRQDLPTQHRPKSWAVSCPSIWSSFRTTLIPYEYPSTALPHLPQDDAYEGPKVDQTSRRAML